MPKRPLIVMAGLLLLGVAIPWLFPSQILREKAATFVVLPTGFIWCLAAFFGVVAWCRQNRLAAWSCWLLWGLLSVAGNAYFSRTLIGSLESQFVEVEPLAESPFSAVIVLGGGSSEAANRMAQLEFAGDRLALAARMYHAGLTPKIICTGARIEGLDISERSQSDLAQEILEDLGVPRGSIVPLAGRTTTEEIIELDQMIQSETRVGLITSAWHLPRAVRLARAAGLELVPLPAGFLSRADNRLRPLDCIPTGNSLLITDFAVKEYLARILGR